MARRVENVLNERRKGWGKSTEMHFVRNEKVCLPACLLSPALESLRQELLLPSYRVKKVTSFLVCFTSPQVCFTFFPSLPLLFLSLLCLCVFNFFVLLSYTLCVFQCSALNWGWLHRVRNIFCFFFFCVDQQQVQDMFSTCTQTHIAKSLQWLLKCGDDDGGSPLTSQKSQEKRK